MVVHWCVLVEAAAGKQGIVCAVTADGSNVYLVGRVDLDAVVVGTDQNWTGGTDMFIVQLEAEQGETTNYIHQIGTAADDYITDVTRDKEGDALLLFTILGSMYWANDTKEAKDIVIMSVSHAEGTFDAPALGSTEKPTLIPRQI
jgi:hypothetical protein